MCSPSSRHRGGLPLQVLGVPILSTAPHPQHSGLNYEQVLSWVLPAEPKPLHPQARLSWPGPHLPPMGAPAPICFPWTPGRGSVSESATVATDVVASISGCSLSHFICENQFPAALSWALIATRRTGSRRGHRRGHSASSPGPPPSPESSPPPLPCRLTCPLTLDLSTSLRGAGRVQYEVYKLLFSKGELRAFLW